MKRSVLFSCRRATREASEGLDHELPFLRKLVLYMHLAMCAACRAYVRQIHALDRLVRVRVHAAQPAPLTAAERERLVRRLRER